MAFDYVDARQAAEEIINDFGKPGQVIKKGVPSGGFDNNGNPIPPTPDVIIDGIVTPKLDFKKSEIDGTAIQRGDSFAFFHSDTKPEIDMQITLNSTTFRIISIKDLTSVDDINVFIRLQLRV